MTESSVGSSGVWGMKSESGTPSPPQQSHSAPVSTVFASSIDEGIEMDERRHYFSDEWKTKNQVLFVDVLLQLNIDDLVIVDVLESDAESCLHCLLFLPWMDAVNESDYGTYVVFSMMSQVLLVLLCVSKANIVFFYQST